MNKKGYSSFIFGMFGLFIVLLSAVVLMPIQERLMEGHSAIRTLENMQDNMSQQFSIRGESEIQNILYSFIDFTVYSSVEVSKLAVRYGIENPEWVNAKNLIYLILLSLLAPLILVLFKILIVIFLLVKEKIQSNKEK